MKRIFLAGSTVFLMLGLVWLIFKLVVIDSLTYVFRPLILLFAGENLVIPITIALTLILIFAVGLFASRIKFQKIVNKYFERMLPGGKHGVLVEKSDGVYDLAVVIKKITLLRLIGGEQTLYLLFYPSIPFVWTSGLPIGLAREDKLTPISSSIWEIYTTIATYGRNAPAVLEEIENKKDTE